MAKEFIYQMQGMGKIAPNGKEILKGIWLSFFPGAKIGVIGPNGSGKSTLLRIMAGVDKEFTGETWVDPSAKIGYLAQEPELDETLDVRGNIELGLAKVRTLLTRFDEVSGRFAEPMSDDEMNALIEEQGKLQDEIEAVDGWNLERTLDIAMDALRVPPGESSVEHLSGGERRRVALCRLLLAQPDLLLLDEPTNHLDAETVSWLERALREYPGTVIIITHDRYFLDNVTRWILELEEGKGIPFEGNYSDWLEQKHKRLQDNEKQASARSKALEEELSWVRMGQKGRQAKSKSRLKRYEELLHNANEGGGSHKREILIPPGPRLGDVVVEANALEKGFGDRLLMEDVTFSLPRGGIVGIIGANGAGKTTLFRMFSGAEEPTSGTLQVGETVVIGDVGQMRDNLDDTKTVWENISDGMETLQMGRREMNSRAYTGAFGFKGRLQQQKAGTLSGGERNRLHLAKVLLAGANLLLLDEPTNDLDVDTLRSLEDALHEFAGCAVVISHDRWFLDRLATHILAFEGNSQVVWFEGNYEDYERDRKRRLGEAADRPKRIKYKPLTRG
jgi:energy-dependent translational throttle protein EttA